MSNRTAGPRFRPSTGALRVAMFRRATPLEGLMMHAAPDPDRLAALSKPELYRELAAELRALLEGERDLVANAANTASLLYNGLPELNWAGFYFLKDGELVLGPFQGRPACVRIALGRGVCGAAAARREPVLVPDVGAFPGHIACDSASRSELVVPLLRRGETMGVLDLDSPRLSRFDEADRDGCVALAGIFLASLDR